jgi:hypothetical protein
MKTFGKGRADEGNVCIQSDLLKNVEYISQRFVESA